MLTYQYTELVTQKSSTETTYKYEDKRYVKITQKTENNNEKTSTTITSERTKSGDSYDTIIATDNDGNKKEWHYYYDDENNLTKMVMVEDGKEDDKTATVYEYNEAGLMTKQSSRSHSDIISITENKYKKIGYANAVKILLGYLR